MDKKTTNKVYLSIAFGLIVFLALTVWGNSSQMADILGRFSLTHLALVVALVLANYFLRFLKWQMYLNSLDISIGRKVSLQIFLSGLAFSITPAKLGEVFKSYMLKGHYGIPITKTAPIVLVDRLTDFIAVLLLSGAGVFLFHYGVWLFISISLLIIILLIILASEKTASRLFTFLNRPGFLSRLVTHAQSAWQSSSAMVKPKPLIITTILSLLAWSAECLAFWFVFQGLGISAISVFAAFFIYAFSTLLGAVSMIPGGLGLQEASMAGLLVIMSLPKGEAAAATLLIRACTLWFAVILGAIILMIFQKRQQPAALDQTKPSEAS